MNKHQLADTFQMTTLATFFGKTDTNAFSLNNEEKQF